MSSILFRIQFGDFLITGGSALGERLAPKRVSFAYGSCPRKERGWGLQNLLPLNCTYLPYQYIVDVSVSHAKLIGLYTALN